jgi:hypothetical protein
MYKRTAVSIVNEALKIAPCVLVCGARQVGKSTLSLKLEMPYKVFDNLVQRAAAYEDPMGYVAALPKPVCLDEVQKVPQILEAIKYEIDKDRKNGTFVLTGSANILDMHQAKDSLAGRVIEITLWPLSAKELNAKYDENIIDMLFKNEIASLKTGDVSDTNIYQTVINGGYPETQKIDSARGKALWFNSYISTYVERDIRDIGQLRDIASFIRFFNILTPRSASLLNKAHLANDANISEATLSNYLAMLQMIYQISLLNAYSSNISKRFIKSPKLYLNDSGILCHILGITSVNELLSHPKKGEVIETFVFSELLKHKDYSQTLPQIYHYRTNDKKEIDFILEKADTIVAVEVKSSASIDKSAFKHITDLQTKSANKKVLGIVFYLGEDILSFSDEKHQRFALPLKLFF